MARRRGSRSSRGQQNSKPVRKFVIPHHRTEESDEVVRLAVLEWMEQTRQMDFERSEVVRRELDKQALIAASKKRRSRENRRLHYERSRIGFKRFSVERREHPPLPTDYNIRCHVAPSFRMVDVERPLTMRDVVNGTNPTPTRALVRID